MSIRLTRFVPLVTLCVGGLTAVAAQSPGGFGHERPIVTAGPGPYRLAIDVPLLAGAAPGATDLRLFDAANREVAYLLVRPAGADPVWRRGSVLTVAPTKKASGFEADFGEPLRIDRFRIGAVSAPFLKRVMLEGSGDRERWTLLVAEGTVFDLPDEHLQDLELPFVAGHYRYVRLTWDDTNSGRVPLPALVQARQVVENAPPPALRAPVVVERRPSEPGRSRYLVRLPGPRLPIAALILDVAPGHVLRDAEVTESRLAGLEAAPATLGRTTLRRAVVDGVTASNLRIPILRPAEPQIDLAIEDGDNAPLVLNGITAEFAELPWIYFESDGSPLVARYGGAGRAAPRYDLEAVRDRLRIDAVRDARWGDPRTIAVVEDRTPAPMPVEGAAIDVSLFRYVRDIPTGAAGLVALPIDAAALAESGGPDRGFGDVRVIDAEGRQVPYLVERRSEPLAIDLVLTPGTSTAVDTNGGRRSVYRVRLPFAGLPAASLVLATDARVFDRRVAVGIERPPDRRRREAWFEELAGGRWVQADRERAAAPLALPIRARETADLVVVVDEGDNRALAITQARLLLPSYRLRFFRQAGAPLRLAYGRDDLSSPRYDLALLAPQVLGVAATEVAAAAAAAPSAITPRSTAFASPLVFWGVLGLAVLVLLGFVVRLLGK
jgi:hypothetical protein